MGSRTIRRGSTYHKTVILEHLVTVPDEIVSNPSNPRIRGRTSGSTQRNLSQFEVVEASTLTAGPAATRRLTALLPPATEDKALVSSPALNFTQPKALRLMPAPAPTSAQRNLCVSSTAKTMWRMRTNRIQQKKVQ